MRLRRRWPDARTRRPGCDEAPVRPTASNNLAWLKLLGKVTARGPSQTDRIARIRFELAVGCHAAHEDAAACVRADGVPAYESLHAGRDAHDGGSRA